MPLVLASTWQIFAHVAPNAVCRLYTQYRKAQLLRMTLPTGMRSPLQDLSNTVGLLLLFQADFRKAKEKVLYKKKEGVPEGLYM